jgi:hypothetical protein
MSRPDPTTGPAADEATDLGGRALRTLLAAASEDQPPTTDLLGKVRHRARRRGALVPSLAAVGVAGMLVAVAVATSTVTAPQPASAQERVAAAVTRTAEDGYRIRAAMSGTKGGRNETSVSQGVYDPAGRAVRMVVVTPDKGHVTIHHLDGRVYVQLPAEVAGRQPGVPQGARWFLRTTRDPNDAGISDLADFGRRALLSPQKALELAQSATDVREVGPVSGDGWTGIRFAFTLTDRQRRRRRRWPGAPAGVRLDLDRHGPRRGRHPPVGPDLLGLRDPRASHASTRQPVYRDPAPDPKESAERLRNRHS